MAKKIKKNAAQLFAQLQERLLQLATKDTLTSEEKKKLSKMMRTLEHRLGSTLAPEMERAMTQAHKLLESRTRAPQALFVRQLQASPSHASSLQESVQRLRPLEGMISSWCAERGDVLDKVACLDRAFFACEILVKKHLRTRGELSSPVLLELEHARRQLQKVENVESAQKSLEQTRATAVKVLAELPACALMLGLEPSSPLAPREQHSESERAELRELFFLAGEKRRSPAVRAVQVGEMLLLWEIFTNPLSGGRWIDLGSGDGCSLARMMALHPERSFLGVDILGSPTVAAAGGADAIRSRLPSHGSYLEISAREGEQTLDPEALMGRMLDTLGAGSAAMVSLLYPLHSVQKRRNGRQGFAHELQLELALDLLEPGGTGLLVTEDPTALRSALHWLGRQEQLESLSYTASPCGEEALLELGISGFSPTRRDVVGREPAQMKASKDPDELLGQFNWGLVVLFTKKR